MCEKHNKDCVVLMFERTFDELVMLESIINLTKEFCLKKDISSFETNLTKTQLFELSEERNNYINMLTIAQDKVFQIKEDVLAMENCIGILQQYANNCCR